MVKEDKCMDDKSELIKTALEFSAENISTLVESDAEGSSTLKKIAAGFTVAAILGATLWNKISEFRKQDLDRKKELDKARTRLNVLEEQSKKTQEDLASLRCAIEQEREQYEINQQKYNEIKGVPIVQKYQQVSNVALPPFSTVSSEKTIDEISEQTHELKQATAIIMKDQKVLELEIDSFLNESQKMRK